MKFKIHIPTRSLFYGIFALCQGAFTVIFPYYSVAVVEFAREHNLYYPIIMLFSTGIFLALGFLARKYWPLIKKSRKLTLVFMISIVLYLIIYDSVSDVGEKLHVLDFSVFSILVYKALSPVVKLHQAFFWAVFLALALTSWDEANQILISGRGGSIHDVLIGLRAGTIGAIFAWIFDSYSRHGREFR